MSGLVDTVDRGSYHQQDVTSPEDEEVDAILQPGERDSGVPSMSDSETSTVPITCLERLIRTHPIWFLPTVSREEATGMLRGKEPGNFVVRQSSQPRTMALTMVLLPEHGVSSQHYLIVHNNNNKMQIENSDIEFDNILSLVYHYFNVGEELPMKLSLPEILREAEARQSLASLALLGRDFWHYPMSNPGRRPLTHLDMDSAVSSSSPASNLSYADIDTAEESESRLRQVVLDHKTSLMLAQSKLLDARWPVGPMEGSIAIPSILGGNLYSGDSMAAVVAGDGLVAGRARRSVSEQCSAESRPPAVAASPVPPPRSSSRQSTASHSGAGSPARSRRQSDSSCLLVTPTVSPRVSRHSVSHMQMSQEDSARGLGKSPTVRDRGWRKSPLHEMRGKTQEVYPETENSSHFPGFAARRRKESVFDKSRDGGDKFPGPDVSPGPGGGHPHDLVSSVLKSQFNKKIHGVRPQVEAVSKMSSSHSPITLYCRSSIADKMSDYEDIWDQTTPRDSGHRDRDRSITPTQSEQQFKAYLLKKFHEETEPTSKAVDVDLDSDKGNSSDRSTARVANSCHKEMEEEEEDPSSSMSETDCLSSSSVSSSISSSGSSDGSPDVSSSSLSTDTAPVYTSSPPNESPVVKRGHPAAAAAAATARYHHDTDLNSFYSDPLDALEEATDTLYNTPDDDSGEGDRMWQSQEDVAVRAKQKLDVRKNRFSDSNIRYVPPDTRKMSVLERIESVEIMKSSSLTNIAAGQQQATPDLSQQCRPLLRKCSTKRSPNVRRKNSKRENRLSAVIGKYIKPPKVGNKSLGVSWQVDCSSWEFLGQDLEDDADVSSDEEVGSNKEVRDEKCPNLVDKVQMSLIRARQSPYDNIMEYAHNNNNNDDDDKDEDEKKDSLISGSSNCSDLAGNSDLVSDSLPPSSAAKESQQDGGSKTSPAESPICHDDNSHSRAKKNSFFSRKKSLVTESPGPARDTTATSRSSRDSVYQSEFDPASANSTGDSSLESCNKKAAEPGRAVSVSLPQPLVIDGCPPQKPEDELLSRTSLNEDYVGVPTLAGLKRQPSESSLVIQECVLRLSEDQTTIFGQNIYHFVQCTLESKERDPVIVMRNMRQFMSGIKNYLVKSGEGDLHKLLEAERAKLGQDEFLNIDSILEEVMHQLVVLPLQKHLSQLFAEDFHRSGCLQLLSENISFALSKSKEEFNVPFEFVPNLRNTIDYMRQCFTKMKDSYSPVEKLGHLLTTIRYILTSSETPCSLSVESFSCLLGYLLVQCCMEWVEVESEYMWGLLHPSLLSGEGGYYLTILSSTIHFLKNIKDCFTENGNTLDNGQKTEVSSLSSPRLSSLDGTIHVIIPDDTNGSIVRKSLPLKPSMTVREVSKIIAHKLRITNPEDFSLYSLVDGQENLLTDSLRPEKVKSDSRIAGVSCTFVYKRQDANIAWPIRQTQAS